MDHSQLLNEVASIRRKAQDDLSGDAWRWLSVWAVLSFGFVVTLAIPWLHAASKWYWAAGVPLGLAGTALAERFDATIDRRVRRREWPYWAAGAGITVLSSAGSFLLPGAWTLVWLWIVLSAGFGVLLRLDGEQRLAQGLWLLAAAFALLAPVATDAVTTSIIFGSVFVVALVGTAGVSHVASNR